MPERLTPHEKDRALRMVADHQVGYPTVSAVSKVVRGPRVGAGGDQTA